MGPIPNALIKDLLSTGYFFKELKDYSESKEIDLPSFSRDFAVPYLTRMSKSYESSGQYDRGKILIFAAKCISNAKDEDLAHSIIELRKVAASEIDDNEKALHQIDVLDRSELLSCRQKSESAQLITKLLVSIIRSFKLAEDSLRRGKAKGACGLANDAASGAEEPEHLL